MVLGFTAGFGILLEYPPFGCFSSSQNIGLVMLCFNLIIKNAKAPNENIEILTRFQLKGNLAVVQGFFSLHFLDVYLSKSCFHRNELFSEGKRGEKNKGEKEGGKQRGKGGENKGEKGGNKGEKGGGTKGKGGGEEQRAELIPHGQIQRRGKKKDELTPVYFGLTPLDTGMMYF